MTNIPLVESPFFHEAFLPEQTDPLLLRIAQALHDDGYAVIDFPDADFATRVEAIQHNLQDRYDWDAWRAGKTEGLRMQDAWRFDENVKQIAANAHIIELLSQLYGKPAFPFQTLNFPVGTQQHYHTDSIHFSSIPERFMCGVWVAFEDVHPDAGPLIYYPGSHKLPIYLNEHVGVTPYYSGFPYGTYHKFIEFWQQLVNAYHLKPIEFLPKKGQAVIWAANLFHGGAAQRDKQRTRWSQVTHYYFRGCAYYTPLGSLPYLGSVEYREEIVDIATGALVPQEINGVPLTPDIVRALSRKPVHPESIIPPDFDDAVYLFLHPDVAAAKVNPREHYLRYGFSEGRQYKASQPVHLLRPIGAKIASAFARLFPHPRGRSPSS